MNISEQEIVLNGISYTKQDILSGKRGETDTFSLDIYRFLDEWFNDSEFVLLNTSGSTGIPKIIEARKTAMMHSARMTCEALNLSCKDMALLCLPISGIAGKMMIVRSLISGMKLSYVKPSGNPLEHLEFIPNFVAMVPLQIYNTLHDPIQTDCLKQIREVIIGGGFVDDFIIQSVQGFPNNIYITYGMTETLSHIALKKLTGLDRTDHYTPFSTVDISKSDNGCLKIKALNITDNELLTNDIVDIYPDGTFKILGRIDNVVNTGGMKIQIEEVERKLKPYLNCDYAISSAPDAKFGEIVILLLVGSVKELNEEQVFANLSAFEKPKQIIQLEQIPLTQTGKIDRAQCKVLIEEELNRKDR